MVIDMKVIGFKIKNMVLEKCFTIKRESILDNLNMEEDMVKAYLPIYLVKMSIQDGGNMVKKMDMAHMFMLILE